MAKKGGGPDWLDDDDFEEDDVVSADDLFEDDQPAKTPVLKRGGRGDEKAEQRSGRDDRASGKESPRSDSAKADRAAEAEENSKLGRMMIKAQRPGEQEVLKSPLILALFGGGLVLLILAATFWFIIGRDSTTRELEAIDAAVSEQRYSHAIKSLEDFLLRHGRDSYTEDARLKLGRIRVEAHVNGSSPDWEKALKAMDQFVDECRDFPKYPEQYPQLADYSKQIALGSLETATKTKDRKLVKVSEDAEVLIDRFSNPDQPPTALHDQIRGVREKALDAIRKHETTIATYEEIQKLLAGKKPIEALKSRRRLLDRYPDLDRDGRLNALLQETLETERKLVAVEVVEREASREDRPLPVPAPLSLVNRNQVNTSSSDETSEGRTVFAVAGGCCYGVDTVTADPVWRRAIGQDTPFFPLSVDTTVPGLLLFDTMHSELVLLNRLTGQLVWRQALGEDVSGEPLVHEGHAYVPTLGSHLYKVDLQTGQINAKLLFSQPVYSPPALTRDQKHLVVAGDEAVCYTLGIQPLECQKVTYTAQRPGAISVPLLSMGNLLLMVENDQVNQSLLRVFKAATPEQGLTEASTVRLNGLVRDQPVLRGSELFVPAEGEQFNVFTVSDAPDKEPLQPIAKPPAASDYSGAVHVLAGPDGLFWSASNSLRQFQLTQDSLDEKKKSLIGASGQPLQNVGTTLFVGRRRLESEAIALTMYDGKELSSPWRTVVGSGVLTWMTQGTSTVIVSRSGELHQVGAAQLDAGGFQFKAEGTLALPDDLDEPLLGSAISGKRLAVTCGGKSPRLWFINETAKVVQDFPLDESPVLPPVSLAGGAVVPLPTKLRLLGAGGSVEDFLGKIEQNEQRLWAHVLPLDDNHLLVVDVQGRLSRIQYRTSPRAHLQQVDSADLGKPVDVAPLIVDGKIIVTDAGGRLQVLNPSGLERVAETQLKAPARGVLGASGNRLLVETNDGQLVGFDLSQNLKPLFSLNLEGDHLTGTPLLEGTTLIVATMNGRVLTFDAGSGEIVRSLQLDSALEHGPVKLGAHVVVMSIDGSLYRVDAKQGAG